MRILQNSGVPIYQQIVEQMKADILEGKMKQGEYFHRFVLDQYVLAEFMDKGHFEQHLSRMRRNLK